MTAPNGALTTIRHGDYAATVTEVGGGLHSLTHAGRDLVVSFPLDALRPNHRGSVLAPWPNRIADGRYEFDGRTQQLPLSEVPRRNAIHGLSSWLPFSVTAQADDHATLAARVWPQTGYPYCLDVEVSYRLDDAGLHWAITSTNVGHDRAPYGVSVHPYLVAGPGHVDDWTLTVPADHYLDVDPERLLPRAVEPVDARLDFRAPRRIGTTELDHAYTGLTATRLELRHGVTGVAMEWTDDIAWLQVHTADRPEPAANRIGMAIEPMTCPPNAFATGTDLVVLEPGAAHTIDVLLSALV